MAREVIWGFGFLKNLVNAKEIQMGSINGGEEGVKNGVKVKVRGLGPLFWGVPHSTSVFFVVVDHFFPLPFLAPELEGPWKSVLPPEFLETAALGAVALAVSEAVAEVEIAIYTSQRSKEANLKPGKKKVSEVVENTEGKQEFKED
ncbi:hypothetical protein BVRB_5g101920 [Beta vulgaris subsp. vulgaris]|nr:hypothetical protein BVRB_5g101920 [Beta vulgaris subsp. vulgaris]